MTPASTLILIIGLAAVFAARALIDRHYRGRGR